MIVKTKKFLSFINLILREPSLINLVLTNNMVQRMKFKQKYVNFVALPQIEIKDMQEKETPPIESFLLDGSSLITDLQLLITLAGRKDMNSYFEIGTWRGESVHNVAKEIADCSTLNLSGKEMKAMGWSPKYADQHAILSKNNPNILHLEGNTNNFDFAGLNKKYDLIFIDGDHTYEMVLSDTKKVFQHLIHENTIVVWHDYAFNPQKVRYEVFQAILDGVGEENHQYLYHPKNTMCAVFYKGNIQTSVFDELEVPTKIYEVSLQERLFPGE